MVASSKRLVATVLCAALAGCATVTSRNVTVGAPPTADAAGLTYFLPKRLMKFTATRMTLVKLEKAVAEAEAAAIEADKAAATAATNRDAAKTKLDKATGADADKLKPQVAELEGKLAEAQAAAETAKTTAGELAAALEDAKAAGSACTYKASLELMPAQADPRFRFVARMSHSGLRDDHMDLKLSSAGLLNSGNVTATDHTGDILVEAVAVAAVLTGNAPAAPELLDQGLGDGEVAAPEPPRCAKLPSQFQSVFDPTDATAVHDLNVALVDAEYPFSLGVEAPSTMTAVSTQDAAWAGFPNGPTPRGARGDPGAGIYYRSAVPVRVSVNRAALFADGDNPNPCAVARRKSLDAAHGSSAAGGALDYCFGEVSKWQPTDAVVAAIPQAGPISFIPMTATAFVKSTDDVVFTDGSVTSWTRDRPSEVLAFVKLPGAALERISSLLTIRLNYTTNRMSLAAKQREEILADLRWRLLQDCVAEARAKDTPVDACLPK